MRIGLLTYHWVSNYGANLQTLSTYSFLEKMGFEPIIINWIPKKTKEYYLSACPREQYECHRSFISERCRQTEEYNDSQLTQDIIRKYDIEGVFIGSDSLFNLEKDKYSILQRRKIIATEDHVYPNPFWGCGFEKVPHVGLSISSQNSDYFLFKDQKERIGESLKSFKAITVRDEWTKGLVSYFTDGIVQPEVTPDPVFAFNNNVENFPSKEEIQLKYRLPEKYVLFCFNRGRRFRVSQKWMEETQKRFHEAGICCVSLPRATGSQEIQLDINLKMPIPPEDWYCIIRYSSGYIGVLMHPIVICIHNAVPFYSFDHYGVGSYLFVNKASSKIYNILESADLLGNYVNQLATPFKPSPQKVFDSIINFPKKQCATFAEQYQERCLNNMRGLLIELNK